MTRSILRASCTLACLATAPAWAFDPNNPAASGYTVSLSDDFTAINPKIWENDWWYDTPDACQAAYLPGTLLPSAKGMTMHIQSLEDFGACAGGAQIYSAAHADTAGGFAQRLGYYEASIRSSAAPGTLTAFWLLPESGAWPPELDIEEIRGDYPATVYMTNHTGAHDKQTQYVFTAPHSLGGSYHTYGALITDGSIVWYIDGTRRGETRRGPGETARLFVILSLYTGTCGDGWAGCPRQTRNWSADAHVAWVRAWRAP
jgi:beta-glucanase (GH16 family)